MKVLITGASSGIGEALACAYASRGAGLFLAGRDRERLEAVAVRCRERGAESVSPRVIDVTDAVAMENWIAQVDASAHLDVVYANAGVATRAESAEHVRTTFAINVDGTANTVLPAIDAFRRRQAGGQIVITSSIAGFGPLKGCPSYSASKACLLTWALALRGALKSEGIRVNALCPGFVRSRITDGNDFPMPFLMEAPRAAEIIISRVERDRPVIAFPFLLATAARLLALLPTGVNAFIGRFLPSKSE